MAAHDIRDDENNNKTFNHTRGWINSQVSSQISARNPEHEKEKLKQTTYKTLKKLEENLSETSGYFTVASCPPIPRPRAHAPNKQGGKPAGQDTSSYKQNKFKAFVYFVQNGDVVEDQWSVQAKNLLQGFVKKINLPVRFVSMLSSLTPFKGACCFWSIHYFVPLPIEYIQTNF